MLLTSMGLLWLRSCPPVTIMNTNGPIIRTVDPASGRSSCAAAFDCTAGIVKCGSRSSAGAGDDSRSAFAACLPAQRGAGWPAIS